MSLSTQTFLRFFYWRLRRNRADAFHMMAMLPGLLWNSIGLAYCIGFSRSRRTAVAIALIEHMGDVVVAEPIARLARQRFPDARIIWITRKPYSSLPQTYPEVDHVVTVRCLTEWLLLRRFNLFDVTWDLHVNGRMCPRCAIPQIKPGLISDQANYYDHGTLLEVQCDSAGLPRLNQGPGLVPPSAAVATVNALGLPRSFVAIHCLSSDPVRDWPKEKWRQLIARLTSTKSIHIIELGLRPLLSEPNDRGGSSICGKLTLLETAEVIRRADLFIGVDSGPAHLANAVGTPGVILLGTYRRFRTYMPYNGGYASGENATIVRANAPVASLSVDAVFLAVMNRLTDHKTSNLQGCIDATGGLADVAG